MVCNNHAANVLAYQKLKEEYVDEVVGLSINYQGQCVYLFYDTVHLVKNIRNILLGNKRILFPGFEFFGFEQNMIMPGGELTWRLLHDVHDADGRCCFNLRKAQRLNAQVKEQIFI